MQDRKAIKPIEITLVGMLMLENLLHSVKTESTSAVSELGNDMLVRPVHIWKACSSIAVTLVGMMTLDKLVQEWKAAIPKDLTLIGMLMLDNLLALKKAQLPSEVSESGNDTLVRPLHSANAPVDNDVAAESPTATTLVGIVTDVMPKQLENAAFNTLVMVVEMTMSPLQHALDGLVLLTQPVVAPTDGDAEGLAEGVIVVGTAVGRALGRIVGVAVSTVLGVAVGAADGTALCVAVVGTTEGRAVGSTVVKSVCVWQIDSYRLFVRGRSWKRLTVGSVWHHAARELHARVHAHCQAHRYVQRGGGASVAWDD